MRLTVNYYLQYKDKNSNILISIHHANKRILQSIKVQINPKFWDLKLKRVKRGYKYEIEINRYLDSIKNQLQDYYFSNLENINIQMLRNKLNSILNNIDTINMSELINKYLNELKSKLQPNSIKSANNSLKHFAYYIELHNYNDFSFITDSFALSYINYQTTIKKLCNSTALRYFKHLKQFLLWCNKNEYSRIDINILNVKNIPYLTKENTNTIALTQDELQLIENYIPDNKHYQYVRILFLIQCYTGLRYSDLINLNKSNIKNDRIVLQQIKTSQQIVIPIHNKLQNLLNQVTEFKFIVASEIDRILKIICKNAGVTDIERTVKYFGTKRIEIDKPRYELVSSHTGRRTFITLLLKKGILSEMIMKITGHKSINSFRKYIKLSNSDSFDIVRDAWNK